MSISRQQRGFTLIEMMIVVAIISILAAVAIPGFQEQARKGYRGEGKASAMATAQQLERYFTVANTYVVSGGWATAGIRGYSCDNADTSKCRYIVTPTSTATGYTVTLTPQNWTDTRCGTLTLNNVGTRTVSGTESVAYCWR